MVTHAWMEAKKGAKDDEGGEEDVPDGGTPTGKGRKEKRKRIESERNEVTTNGCNTKMGNMKYQITGIRTDKNIHAANPVAPRGWE